MPDVLDGAGNPASYKEAGDPQTSIHAAQWWLLFAVLVANKPARITTKKLNEFLNIGATSTPFIVIEYLLRNKALRSRLEWVRTGQYDRIERTFTALVDGRDIDPRLWTLEKLEGISGIGPKTARWYYLLINPTAKIAALDTHVLKFLRDNGVEKVPKSTPPAGPVYARLEAEFIKWTVKLGLAPRDLDYVAWTVYRNGGQILFSQ